VYHQAKEVDSIHMLNIGVRRGKNTLSIKKSNIIAFICAIFIFKSTYQYYILLFPSLSFFITILYQVATVFCFSLLPITLGIMVTRKTINWGLVRPAILILVCVILNIIIVMFQEANIEILSRSYTIPNAITTNDYTGFYFATINTWFGNIGCLLFVYFLIRNKKTLHKCIVTSMLMFVLPIVLIILMHPEYVGLRESLFSDIVFGGGIWNIGVCGFGSLAWLGISQISNISKKQKILIIFSIALFCFAGISGLSRTLIFMMIFSIFFYILFSKKDITWLKLICFIFAFIGVFIILENNIATAIIERLSRADTSATQNVRWHIWKTYLSYVREYFWFGAPSGSVYNYYIDVNWKGHDFLPHSSVLNFLIRFGVFSLVGYLLLIKNAFIKSTIKNRHISICLKAWVISYIALSFVNQTGYAGIEFYLGFGLLFATINIENQENQRRINICESA
jgi:hypothetical protein